MPVQNAMMIANGATTISSTITPPSAAVTVYRSVLAASVNPVKDLICVMTGDIVRLRVLCAKGCWASAIYSLPASQTTIMTSIMKMHCPKCMPIFIRTRCPARRCLIDETRPLTLLFRFDDITNTSDRFDHLKIKGLIYLGAQKTHIHINYICLADIIVTADFFKKRISR